MTNGVCDFCYGVVMGIIMFFFWVRWGLLGSLYGIMVVLIFMYDGMMKIIEMFICVR